jgi:hypothetical protein
MVLFGLLFVPLFLLFWISFPQNRMLSLSQAALALFTGTALASIRYLLFGEPRFRDFGPSLYGGALLGNIMIPTVVQGAVFFLLKRLYRPLRHAQGGGPGGSGGETVWLLCALVPYSAVFALSVEPGTVKPQVLMQLLWIMTILGVSFFYTQAVRAASGGKRMLWILFVLLAAAVPFLAAAVNWAWYAKEPVLFGGFLAPLAVPAVLKLLLALRSVEES